MLLLDVVLSHNDLLSGNVLHAEGWDRVQVIPRDRLVHAILRAVLKFSSWMLRHKAHVLVAKEIRNGGRKSVVRTGR